MYILIAHHQEKVRTALTFLLSQEPNIHVVGEASNLEELGKVLGSTQPDVLVLDCDLSAEPLTEQVVKLREKARNLKVVVLGSSTETRQTISFLSDYIHVDITAHPKHLVTALRVLQLESEYE